MLRQARLSLVRLSCVQLVNTDIDKLLKYKDSTNVDFAILAYSWYCVRVLHKMQNADEAQSLCTCTSLCGKR